MQDEASTATATDAADAESTVEQAPQDGAPAEDVDSEDLLETEQNPLPHLADESAAPESPEAEAAVESPTDGNPVDGNPVDGGPVDGGPAPESPASAAPPARAASPRAEPHPLDAAQHVLGRLRDRMRAQVLGRDDVIDLVLVALLADGHVLLEDFPGSGKTTLAKSLGTSITEAIADVASEAPIAPFRRIQFTPDLLPSDVTGVSVFETTTSTFSFRRGPIFAHVVLADEINRTSPKVQSAMLEAMAEKQVTVDNVTYPLDDLFFVIATQNPLDLAGTYPLPVAQLDRFLFKIRMEHIDRDAELEVLSTWRSRRDVDRTDLPRVTRAEVLGARRAVDAYVAIDPRIQEALVDIAQAARDDERVLQGCSTRSLVLMLPALQALAALEGRDYVTGDDISRLAPRVLGHRLELVPGLANTAEVIGDAVAGAIEGLSRGTLKGGSGGR
ncbi:MAG: AAA family ATPase [Acidobacteriota bacterium]